MSKKDVRVRGIEDEELDLPPERPLSQGRLVRLRGVEPAPCCFSLPSALTLARVLGSVC